MRAIKDLGSLLMHHLQNLYSAEEQMTRILPVLIKKAKHPSLKNLLKHHMAVTREQKKRLEQMPQLLTDGPGSTKQKKKKGSKQAQKAEGFDKQYVCKGMAGLVEETNELLTQRPSKDVMDAGIITCVQKMEHYEICTYGTALAYAQQLQLQKAEELLQESLNESCDTDELLTDLAISALNKEAEPDDNDHHDEGTHRVVAPSTKVSKAIAHITERSIKSPGGRSGTSHRRYRSGESRGR